MDWRNRFILFVLNVRTSVNRSSTMDANASAVAGISTIKQSAKQTKGMGRKQI